MDDPRIASQKNHRPSGDSPHLGKTALEVHPLMNGKGGHAGVELMVSKRQCLSDSIDGDAQMLWTLGSHGRRGFDGGDIAIKRFV